MEAICAIPCFFLGCAVLRMRSPRSCLVTTSVCASVQRWGHQLNRSQMYLMRTCFPLLVSGGAHSGGDYLWSWRFGECSIYITYGLTVSSYRVNGDKVSSWLRFLIPFLPSSGNCHFWLWDAWCVGEYSYLWDIPPDGFKGSWGLMYLSHMVFLTVAVEHPTMVAVTWWSAPHPTVLPYYHFYMKILYVYVFFSKKILSELYSWRRGSPRNL